MLIALPYCVAIGTGNSINTQIIAALAPWGAVIGILAIGAKGYRNALATILCAIFVSTIALQVFLCSLSPYHLNSSIWEQDVPTKIGMIGSVKTDQTTHDYVLSLSNAMKDCKISADRPFLGFYDLPGAALVIESIPVFTPWLNYPGPSEVILRSVDPIIIHSAIVGILLNPDGSMPKLPEQFNDFPKGYKMCSESIYPDYPHENQKIQIWLPEN